MDQAKKQYKNSTHFNGFNFQNLVNPIITDFPKFSPKIKLGVLASGNGSNFEYLIKSIQENKLNAEIAILIVNNPDCLAIQKAKQYEIEYEIINHRKCNSRTEHDLLVMSSLSKHSVELVVMAGWMRIVGECLINKYENRLINIHPSLLPSFKGIDAIQQAIDSNVTITGCSVHIVKKEVDSGSIIIQAAVPMNKNESKDLIKARIQKMEHKILPFAVAIVAKNIRDKFMDRK